VPDRYQEVLCLFSVERCHRAEFDFRQALFEDVRRVAREQLLFYRACER